MKAGQHGLHLVLLALFEVSSAEMYKTFVLYQLEASPVSVTNGKDPQ
jgi:hypothetical protein